MQPMIIVENLQKKYRIPIRKTGLLSSIKSLFYPAYTDVNAVSGIDFVVNKGEIVGFIGPNGAGKTTTLKMLSGLLYPTSGKINIAGYTPWERKVGFLRNISMVMGNKSQLTWENTVADSFYILKEIYHVSNHDYKERIDELVNLLDIEKLLPKLARNLSLGERAKCEFATALIHHPDVLFLDEPTLGLDVTMQLKLRKFIKDYNKKHNTTIIITSHYMADISSLCKRVLLIHNGKFIFDGELSKLAEKIQPFRLIKITLGGREKLPENFSSYLDKKIVIVEQEERHISLRVRKEDITFVAAYIINNIQGVDITVQEPPIEAVIDQVFREGIKI